MTDRPDLYVPADAPIPYEAPKCPTCGKKFQVGEAVIFTVKELNQWGGITLETMHRECPK